MDHIRTTSDPKGLIYEPTNLDGEVSVPLTFKKGDPALKNAATLVHYGIKVQNPDASGFTFVGYNGSHSAGPTPNIGQPGIPV